mgnify:CR=1 FL=1
MRPEEDKFIERLYLDTFQLLWTYAMSKLNNPALAQEVVQYSISISQPCTAICRICAVLHSSSVAIPSSPWNAR